MGCTSSAPNMVSSSTAEKSIQFEEEMSDESENQSNVEEIIYRAERNSIEINKLPSSDTATEQSADIVRNRSTHSLKNQTDTKEDRFPGHQVMNKSESSLVLEEEHPPKLEEVVEKVVELHSLETVNEIQPVTETTVEDPPNKSDDNNSLKESHDTQDNEEKNGPAELDKQKEEHPEEATSPSQSESSRATRWEALADIAAELPPSLTVDPITGQIYALSK
ncbi:uncharacterized protein LOC124635191 isoform X1 [Helicoverpa zea]|uniref:uncharacterized protein LOC124635191 isoform X1 n=2 Tax=Helicoverpa zea TaxID=7113 RepID=UPI001F579308|nr:uncharacterized protein LOC124635191 isoform X1 [Helicoverpa zea]